MKEHIRPTHIEEIRARRKQVGLSARDVARRAGLNSELIAKLERGGVRRVRAQTAYSIGRVLDLDPAVVGGLPPWAEASPRHRLRILRYRRGWSKATAADRAGVCTSTLNTYETTRIPKDPTFLSFVTLALCGRAADVLTSDTDPQEKSSCQ